MAPDERAASSGPPRRHAQEERTHATPAEDGEPALCAGSVPICRTGIGAPVVGLKGRSDLQRPARA
eukprot:2263692-Prymnesium_polylepis.1